jgi:uncharacterized protein with HEPN domain
MKKDSVYLRHILESIEKIESYATVIILSSFIRYL